SLLATGRSHQGDAHANGKDCFDHHQNASRDLLTTPRRAADVVGAPLIRHAPLTAKYVAELILSLGLRRSNLACNRSTRKEVPILTPLGVEFLGPGRAPT